MTTSTDYDVDFECSFFKERLDSASSYRDVMEIRCDVLRLLSIVEYQLNKVDEHLENAFPDWGCAAND